jgi:menaquinone-dependent protoporphyrinogen oxidase
VIVLFGVHRTMITLDSDHVVGPFAESSCGSHEGDAKRVLVVYDSKYGSTGGTAVAIGEALCEKGFAADVRLAGNVDQVKGYDAAVVGAPLYNGRWMAGTTDFLEKYEDALSGLKVAYFIAGNLMRPEKDTPDRRTMALKWFIGPVVEDYPAIKPLDNYGIFAGKVDTGKMTAYEHFIMWVSGEKDADHRDYEKVKAWAHSIAPALAGGN